MSRTLSFYALVLQKDFSNFCNQKLQEIGVTQGLLYFILYIGKHPGCSTGALIQALHMDWGHAQRSVDKLAQDGFVTKEKNSLDRRVCTLTLTPKGETAFEISHRVLSDWDAAALGGLSAQEKDQLFTVLEKLVYCKEEYNDYLKKEKKG